MKLIELPGMEDMLKNEKPHKIVLLHKLIFNSVGDRSNRKRLRIFPGFLFAQDSQDLTDKITNTVSNFKLNELISIANTLCIDSDGSHNDLATRIVSSLNNLEELKNNIINDDALSDSDPEEISPQNPSGNNSNIVNDQTRNNSGTNSLEQQLPHQTVDSKNMYFPDMYKNPTITFDDIKSFVAPFTGQTFESIESWVQNFEDAACILNLNELQKLIFAKRLCSGKAQLFVLSETKLRTWQLFKEAILSEFGSTCNSADLHELLSKRKMKSDESLDEYFFNMKQIANKGMIEDAALIRYIIHGIPGSAFKKSILYNCNTLLEFKHQLRLFQNLCQDDEKARLPRPKYEVRHTSDPQISSRPIRRDCITSNNNGNKPNISCFNCGDLTHVSKYCPHKHKGSKCFRCFQFGHKSYECKTNKDKKHTDKPAEVHIIGSQNLLLKDVTLCSETLTALIDTGSQKTLLKKSVFDKFADSTQLHDTTISLIGLGQTSIKPLGHFQADIIIDNSIFSTDIFVLYDHFINFDLLIGTDVIQQGTLTVSSAGVSLSKPESDSENFLISLVNVVDDSLLDLCHIQDPKLRSELSTLIQNYVPHKSKSVDIQMKILLSDDIPIYSSPRRLPQTEKKIVEAQISEWLEQGIIRRSSSDYSAPLVLVKKKDNSYRLCVDYRRLNKKIIREHFPLPVIDDVIDQLHSARVFTTLDLKNGFFHVDVDESSRKFTSFVTHEGQYEFCKCPFGLTNSPSVFQKYIYNVFRQLLKDGVVVIYMDDLIIPSHNEAEGIQKLKLVLQTAAEHGIEFNLKKCHFLKREIEFLGYKIIDGHLYPSSNKTKAVLHFPEPQCTKDVQSFLGLTGYFRKFIRNYSIIAKPLSDLLKKGVKFQFGPNERNSFTSLQNALANTPVLSIYNPNAETEIHCDASIDGYGAVLIQKSIIDNQFHPVYFMSKKTTPAQRRYSSYELEVMAIIEALKKFRIYVFGIPFKIVTDCNAFKMTMEKKDISAKIARWAFLLSDFNYTIEHRKGSSMRHVDALSRNPICMVAQDSLTLKITAAQNTDDRIQVIKRILETQSYEDYFTKNNVLYKIYNGLDLLVVPDDMQLTVIKHIHEQGHFARKHCEAAIKQQFYIPNLTDKIDKILSNCVTCILYNRKHGKKEGELHPLPKEETPLQTYHIDHLGPLQTTNKNYNHILCIIDAFTKFVWLYPCKTTTTSEVIAKLQFQSYIFGNPLMIISDKGSAFTSNEFAQYCQEEGIKHLTVTTGLPRANGQVERLNSTIISVISKLSQDAPDKWFKHVPRVQQIINSTFQRSIKRTPFELLIGVKMRQKTDLHLVSLLNSILEEQFIDNRENLRAEAKQNIMKVQQENKRQYNLRRKPPQKYQVGDLVAIKRTHHGPGLKFKSRFLGPYRIKKCKPNDTYDVEKAAITDGPMNTSTCAEYMKPWPDNLT